MEEAHQAVAVRHLLHHLHGDLVVVAGGVGIGVDGGHLVLGGGHLVMLGLGEDAQRPQCLVQVLHIGGHTGLDGAEVVVLQLLAPGGLGAEQGPAGHLQILALPEELLVDEEILLLRAHLGGDPLGLGVAEEPQDADGLTADLVHGPQQGGLLIQGVAGVGAEDGGDAEGVLLDKGEGGGVPGGVAPGLEGGPQAAGGEGGRVRLPPDQLLAGKLHQRPAGLLGGDEGLMLLGGDAGHGLEPVGVVGGPVVHGPVLHFRRHFVGGFQGEGGAILHALLPRPVAGGGEPLLHDVVVEHQAAEQLGHFFLGHRKAPCTKMGVSYPRIVFLSS